MTTNYIVLVPPTYDNVTTTVKFVKTNTNPDFEPDAATIHDLWKYSKQHHNTLPPKLHLDIQWIGWLHESYKFHTQQIEVPYSKFLQLVFEKKIKPALSEMNNNFHLTRDITAPTNIYEVPDVLLDVAWPIHMYNNLLYYVQSKISTNLSAAVLRLVAPNDAVIPIGDDNICIFVGDGTHDYLCRLCPFGFLCCAYCMMRIHDRQPTKALSEHLQYHDCWKGCEPIDFKYIYNEAKGGIKTIATSINKLDTQDYQLDALKKFLVEVEDESTKLQAIDAHIQAGIGELNVGDESITVLATLWKYARSGKPLCAISDFIISHSCNYCCSRFLDHFKPVSTDHHMANHLIAQTIDSNDESYTTNDSTTRTEIASTPTAVNAIDLVQQQTDEDAIDQTDEYEIDQAIYWDDDSQIMDSNDGDTGTNNVVDVASSMSPTNIFQRQQHHQNTSKMSNNNNNENLSRRQLTMTNILFALFPILLSSIGYCYFTSLNINPSNTPLEMKRTYYQSTTTIDDKKQQQQVVASTILPSLHKQQKEPFTLMQILLSRNGKSGTCTDTETDAATPNGFHLAIAPASFGYYAYFGVISAWYDTINKHQQEEDQQQPCKSSAEPTTTTTNSLLLPIKSVVGASEGATVAMLLGANISPQDAMLFFTNITDANSNPIVIAEIEESVIPIAVTVFDNQTQPTQILTTGCMARETWLHYGGSSKSSSKSPNYLRVPGIIDKYGIVGLNHTLPFTSEISHNTNQRQLVIHLQLVEASSGRTDVWQTRPRVFPKDIHGKPDVVTISIIGLPSVTPYTMPNGPITYELAREATFQALNEPLQEYTTTVKDVDSKKEAKFASKHYHLVIDLNRPKEN